MKKNTTYKILAVAMSLVLLVGGVIAWNANRNVVFAASQLGDVDGDGSVTAADARLALRASVNLEHYELGSREFIAADYDRDGTITAGDARMILRTAVDLEPAVYLEDENEPTPSEDPTEPKPSEPSEEPGSEPYDPAYDPEPVTYGDGIHTCKYCGKNRGVDQYGNCSCAFGGCTRFLGDVTCVHCGEHVPANTCHTCVNPTFFYTEEPEK